jgi:hypothetical protein
MVSSIWNIKQYRKSKFEPPMHKKDTAQCAVKDMGKQKTTATLNHDASNVPEIIP